MNSDLLAEGILADLADLGCTISVDRGRIHLTRPKVVISPSKLAAVLKRLKEHREAVIAAVSCLLCGRDIRDPEDRERLLEVNPFCSESKCPFRNSNR